MPINLKDPGRINSQEVVENITSKMTGITANITIINIEGEINVI